MLKGVRGAFPDGGRWRLSPDEADAYPFGEGVGDADEMNGELLLHRNNRADKNRLFTIKLFASGYQTIYKTDCKQFFERKKK